MSARPETEPRPFEYLAWYGGGWAYDDYEDPPPAEPAPPVETPTPPSLYTLESFGAEQRPGQGKGVVLGRFLPPHRGHQFLVEFARSFVEELGIFVRVAPDDPIPGEVRVAWLRELFRRTRIVAVEDGRALPHGNDAELSRFWKEQILQHFGQPDFLFGSEPHGSSFAGELGAAYVPVDPDRETVPISGTAIREHPLAHWEYLPPCVRPHYVRRVCIIGPESTGKTTLAAKLARRFETVAVAEYARTFTRQRGRAWQVEDTQTIARGQLAAQQALARQANRVLICDTDLLSVQLWSERRFGVAPEWVREQAGQNLADLYLLMEDDLPYKGEPEFDHPEQRQAFFQRCREELAARNVERVLLRGKPGRRTADAVAVVAALIERKR